MAGIPSATQRDQRPVLGWCLSMASRKRWMYPSSAADRVRDAFGWRTRPRAAKVNCPFLHVNRAPKGDGADRPERCAVIEKESEPEEDRQRLIIEGDRRAVGEQPRNRG